MKERRNPFFTGREEILATMATFFANDQQTMALALCGMCGIGKTQIAIEYAYRHEQEYQIMLWLTASSRAVLFVGISAFADEHLSLCGKDRINEQRLFAAVKHWLQDHEHWLLVLDDLEELSLIEEIVPSLHGGHVLLTTRRQATGAYAHGVAIGPMNTEESTLFLLRRAGFIPPKGQLMQAPAEVAQDATNIERQVNGYPLALDQVGASFKAMGRSDQKWTTMLGQRRQLVQDHLSSVASTLEQVAKRLTPAALRLLHLLSFLHSDIPDSLLIAGAPALSKSLRSLIQDDLAFDQAIANLLDFSLVDRYKGILHIHPIAQMVIINTLSARQQYRYASQVVCMVNLVFPEVRFDAWSDCECYLSQAQHCSALIRDFQLPLVEGALLLERLGTYCFRRGCYTEAETYLTQTLRLHEQQAPIDEPNTAQTLNSLGLLADHLAHYQQAEAFHRRALELREHAFGPDHPQVLESLHNLALLSSELGQYDQAEQIYLHVLSLEEASDDVSEAETAATVYNLGQIYHEQGRYEQAELFYWRALSIYERALSANHPYLAYPLNGLGALAEDQGDFSLAEEFYQRAFAIRERALGPNHPDLAYQLNNLANVYASQGKYTQAEPLYQRALTIAEYALAPEHPDIALYLNNLALLATKQGHYEEAEPLYQRALRIYEQAVGTEHPHVASVMQNLGRLAQKMGDAAQAETFLRRALVIREQTLGPEHPHVAQSLNYLAGLLTDLYRDEEAERLYQRALQIYEQARGTEHPDILSVLEQYTALQERMEESKADERKVKDVN